MENHLTEKKVFDLLLSPESETGTDRDHRTGCTKCRELWSEIGELFSHLSEKSVWSEVSAGPLSESSGNRLRSLLALESRLDRERREARERLARENADRWVPAAEPTVGLVDLLVDTAEATTERDPGESERLARFAVEKASQISSGYPPDVIADANARAWKMLANAQRMIGRLDDALSSLGRANTFYNRTTVPAPGLAATDYIRATVYLTQGKTIDARRLVRSSIDTFGAFGQDQQRRNAQLLLSAIEYRAGALDTAIEILEALLSETAEVDTTFRGRILHNLGTYLIEREPLRASACLRQAQHCLAEAGLETEALRSLWKLGDLAFTTGDLEGAEEKLDQAFERAVTLGLEIDAALIMLDRARIALSEGQTGRVIDLSGKALAVLQRASAPLFAAQAFEYLRAAASQGHLEVEHLSFVRDFLESAPDEDVVFQPPS